MWIFCGGMQRSGSTLQYQVISEILELKGIGKRIEWKKPEMFPKIRKKYEKYDKYKVFKSHIFTGDIREEFENNNAWGLYIYRDIRDVIVSFMQKKDFSFQQVIKGPRIKKCIDNYYRWTGLQNVYTSRYEEVIKDLKNEIFRIADFFKIDISKREAAVIKAKLSMSNQRERIDQIKNQESYVVIRKKEFDPVSLLHMNHIQDGKVGKWKDILTSSQAHQVKLMYGEWLTETGYNT